MGRSSSLLLCERSRCSSILCQSTVPTHIAEALRDSHADEAREHAEAIGRLQAEYERQRRRIHAVYTDKLDGRIDTAFYDQITETMRADQDRCLIEIKWHQNDDRSYMEDGIALLELAGKAQRLFVSANRTGSGAC